MDVGESQDRGVDSWHAMTATERQPLTKERIITAAVAFADEHGIEALSMRKLGSELGVEAMSLYNHVEDKGDLLDAMVDHVFAEIPLPPDDIDWRDQTRLVGQAAISSFTRHPWVVNALMERGNTGPGSLGFMNHILGVLTDAGFADEDVHHAWQMLASHTMGYAFQASTGSAVQQEEYASLEVERARIAQHYPHVARLAPLLVGCAWDTEYMFGLEIIIDGLESRLQRSTGASDNG